jgi:hypothetical protein
MLRYRRKTTKLLHFRPHKISAVRKLYETDCTSRVESVNRYFHRVYTLETDLTVFPSADDGWFPIGGYLTLRITRPRLQKIPR